MFKSDSAPASEKGASPRGVGFLPARLGRYEIRSVIGRGMMGVVYGAWDPLLGRRVALKVLRVDFPMREDEHQLMEQRFLREASLAASLSHPNIVTVHDVGRDPDTNTPFIALEYLEGRTLAEIASPVLLDWREALRLAARLADALHHAHGHGVIHRDIKPSNVMVLPTGEPRILDFGIARAAAAQFTAAGETFGTPYYMSPEQATARTVDGRSDLFSLGSVLYELLTGRRAFAADSMAQVMARVVRDEPPLPTSVNPTLPAGVDTIVARALAKDPGQRYPDGLAFAEDIEDLLQGRPVRGRSLGIEARAPRDAPSWAWDACDASGTPTTRISARRSALSRRVSRRMRRWGPGFVLGASLAVAVMLVPATSTPVAPTGPAFGKASAPWAPVAAASSTTPPVLALDEHPSEAALAPQPHPEPAHVALSVEHRFERGELRVWVDGTLVLERALAATQTRSLLFFKRRKGTFADVLQVLPGERLLRLEVVSDGVRRSAELRGVFKSDETRLLEVKLGGKVELDWKS